MKMWRKALMSSAVGFGVLYCAAANAALHGGCRFNSETLRFAGTVAETTACLLRRVRERGGGADPQPVPLWLLERITRPVPMTAVQLQRYLERNGIDPATLTDHVVVGDTPTVRYFVIHDTSSPEIDSSGTAFPSNINDSSYSVNTPSLNQGRVRGWPGLQDAVNLLVTRTGQSGRFTEWGATRSVPATKIERASRVPAARPLFVHVENIQPRIRPPGSWAWRAPVPGFSPAQQQRLALAYIVASMRAGRWLIPAYHFNIDQGIPDAHDDPQHADLADWVARIEAIETEMMAN